MGAALTPRERHVLKFLVEHHLETGRPVGSRVLARICGLGLSPATIRNVVADLEAKGYVYAPHTSAGRVPTVKGYRYFLEELLAPRDVQDEIVEQLWRSFLRQTSPHRLLETACQLLARLTQLIGVATLPRGEAITVKQIELIPVGEGRVLTLLVTSDEEVFSEVILPKAPLATSELVALSRSLGRALRGQPLTEFSKIVEELAKRKRSLEALGLSEVIEKALSRRTFVAGEIHLFDFPEEAAQLRSLYCFLKNQKRLETLSEALPPSRPSVFLGEELSSSLKVCSLVAQPHPLGGMIGVVGPVRMDYARIVPLVETTTRLLGLALSERRATP